MSEVHAPYHFVPLSKWVYMPDWAHLVSHDVPFKDGYSGVIDYTLTNTTPLCVGGEKIKKEGEPTLIKWTKDPSGNPVIPGSSLKGMIRNVLEIASFGKFNAVEQQRFSFRDVSGGSHYLKTIGEVEKNVISGWIKYNAEEQKWQFRECQYAKVSHKNIQKEVGKHISNSDTATQKYLAFPLDSAINADISAPKGKQNNRWAESLNKGKTPGHFVFTSKRIEGRGKKEDYDFSYFFYNTENTVRFENIKDQVKNLFSNHDQELVRYLKEKGHPVLGIPVFALLEKQNRNKIHSFGFSKMPRISYKYDTTNLVNNHSKAHNSEAHFDLAELIFGTLRDNALGLKGRVTFADAVANFNKSAIYESNKIILNSPKPTFFPAYLEQGVKPNDKKYNDYDNASKLSGFKRYISKDNEFEKLTENNQDSNNNVSCILELAPKNSHFSGKIVFHNLHPIELGALLWCLEFGGNSNYYHQLGHGKPFRAGAVQLKCKFSLLKKNDSTQAAPKEELLEKFVTHMDRCYPQEKEQAWQTSPQITNLLAISALNENKAIDTSYMSIDKKDYQNAKTKGQILEPFKGLNRNDPADFNKHLHSASFGEGRLANLIDKDSNWHQELLTAKEKQKQEQRQKAEAERTEAEKAAKLANMTPCMQKVEHLKDALTQCNDATGYPPLLRETAQLFVDSNGYQSESAQALYKLLRDYDFHKTPKKRVKEQKAILQQLIEKYDLKV